MVVKKTKEKKKLGTGLSSLLVNDEELSIIVKKQTGRPVKKIQPGEFKKNLKSFSKQDKGTDSLLEIPTHRLVPGKFQPRKDFNLQEIEELAESIKQNGILQPILVRPLNARGKSFEIIAGERRWRAAQLAKLHEVPVIIRKFDDETSLGVALIENLQRSDLNLIEEAQGYRLLMNKFEYTQEKLSNHLGKSRSHIANLLRLLSLPQNIKTILIMGDLTYGHVRAILTLNENETNEIVSKILDKGLSVRETEGLVKKLKNLKNSTNSVQAQSEDPNISYLEKELTTRLGLRVKITNKSKNKGHLSIYYNTVDQLNPIIDKLRWRPR